jgi:Flp pilus assembly protein TadG
MQGQCKGAIGDNSPTPQGPAVPIGMARPRWGTEGAVDIVGLTRRRRSERLIAKEQGSQLGQALVEFALVAPIMALILAGLVQFAFIYQRQIGIENAVRDDARRGATYTTDSSNAALSSSNALAMAILIRQKLVDTAANGGLLASNVSDYDPSGAALISASVCYRTDTDAAGKSDVFVKVSVTYAHPLFMPIITPLIDGIDGYLDNAFRISTSSEFQVGTQSLSVGATPICAS